MRREWMMLVLLIAGGAMPVAAGLEELASRAEWARVVEVALRRSDQLPLRVDEAFVAAVAAGVVENRAAQEQFLELAVREGPLAEVARVELAQLLAPSDGRRALQLVVPLLRRPPTPEVQAAAVAVAEAALDRPLPRSLRAELERLPPALPHALRRSLEVKLAVTAGDKRRQLLGDVLESSAQDGEALLAARALLSEDELSSRERWWIAQAFYRHALYGPAQDVLGALERGDGAEPRQRWRVAFLAGRCAFRQGEFEHAASLYREAIAHAGGGEPAADLEVHLARALELGGRLDDAVTAAQRAVRLRPTDERRLFLARLRLRSGAPDYARLGISRIRARVHRERGQLLLGLYEMASGSPAAARRRLEGIRHRPWSPVAAVLAGEIAASRGDWEGLVALLEDGARFLPPFWAEEARKLLEQAPAETVKAWRQRQALALATGSETTRRRALATWAVLENDEEALAGLRARVAAEEPLALDGRGPAFEPGLALELWRRGLAERAVRWDPKGLPQRDADSAVWSAGQMLAHGAPEKAIATADAAWRMAGSEIPIRAYPDVLARALYPLPYPELVRRAAAMRGVPWSLLAALAREESRWSPRAVSVVGARGLLQLLPDTARAVAERLGRSPPTAEELLDPAASLDLGAAEMARLLGEYGGRWAPAVAAYNAGQAQAALWLSECAPECSRARYVATISFAVTRRYTSQVLAGAGVYARLYPSAAGTPPGGSNQRQ